MMFNYQSYSMICCCDKALFPLESLRNFNCGKKISQHKGHSLNHFEVYSSVVLGVFTSFAQICVKCGNKLQLEIL